MKNFIKTAVKIFIIFMLMVLCPHSVKAEDNTETVKNYMYFDTSKADEAAQNTYGLSIKGTAESLIDGTFSFWEIFDIVLGQFFSDISNQIASCKKIVGIVLICGILKSISISFGKKSVCEIGFFVCYMLVILIIINSFKSETYVVRDNIKRFGDMNTAMVPVYAAISTMTGRSISVSALAASSIGFSSVISFFLNMVLVPSISVCAGLEAINNVFDEDMISSLCGFLKYILSLCLKAIGICFTAVLSVQRLSTGASSAFAMKAAKNITSAVPVVGDIISSSAQTVYAAGSAVGNTVAAASIIIALVVALSPVIRLTAVFLIFKITAALTEPVAEKRITKTLNAAAEYFALFIGVLFLSAFMFIYSSVILGAVF